MYDEKLWMIMPSANRPSATAEKTGVLLRFSSAIPAARNNLELL